MPDNQEPKELVIVDWRKWSLHQKRAYVKGSGGGFNLKRSDIAALDDAYRGMQYTLKTIRMAVDVIDELSKQLTAAQQALDTAVEALKAGKDAIEIFILEKAAQEDPDSMAELFELIKTSGKKIHELIAERYNKIEAALASIKE